jgi:hypothetical protein
MIPSHVIFSKANILNFQLFTASYSLTNHYIYNKFQFVYFTENNTVEFELTAGGEIMIGELFPNIKTQCVIKFERIEGDLHLKTYNPVGSGSIAIPLYIRKKKNGGRITFFYE